MTVDWFLIDAPRVVPDEFSAWEVAESQWIELFYRLLDAKAGSHAERELEHQVMAAKREADRLEQVARAIWAREHCQGRMSGSA
ncbi:hypothetical protein [Cupriavidus sp. M-11]|uniref:hypothetical protein n=1 Tax=Cupriavidus sp. M-11 TaxID=3233038 RepID=UPI003F93C2DA